MNKVFLSKKIHHPVFKPLYQIERGETMSYEDHMNLLAKTNKDYYNYHESILLAKQTIERQKKAHYAGQQK